MATPHKVLTYPKGIMSNVVHTYNSNWSKKTFTWLVIKVWFLAYKEKDNRGSNLLYWGLQFVQGLLFHHFWNFSTFTFFLVPLHFTFHFFFFFFFFLSLLHFFSSFFLVHFWFISFHFFLFTFDSFHFIFFYHFIPLFAPSVGGNPRQGLFWKKKNFEGSNGVNKGKCV